MLAALAILRRSRLRTKEDAEDHVRKTIEIADDHRVNSDQRMEKFCLRGACVKLIRISVEEFSNPSEAKDYLRNFGLPNYLKRFICLNGEIYQRFKESPKHPQTEVTTDVSIVHFLWLMGMFEEAETMIAISSDESVWKYYPVHRLWKDYHRMVFAFSNHEKYEPKPPKLNGYEKHWLPYIQLMERFTKSEDISDIVIEIDESFEKRNRDKRLEDYPGFDGDGRAPVKWDLRKHTILECGARFYGYS